MISGEYVHTEFYLFTFGYLLIYNLGIQHDMSTTILFTY